MKTRRRLIMAFAASLLFVGAVGQANWWPFSGEDSNDIVDGDLTELGWADLIPDDFVQPENPFAKMSQDEIDVLLDGSDESNAELERLQNEFSYAPVVDELDGKRVKIPAYITPLDFDGNTRMKEFLLVPYVGACMHTPPPPANQIVHAESADTIELKSIYDAVWAIGTIRTQTVKSDIAESGYRLEVEQVLPYSVPEAK